MSYIFLAQNTILQNKELYRAYVLNQQLSSRLLQLNLYKASYDGVHCYVFGVNIYLNLYRVYYE